MTQIQWTDETWNSIVGCSKISPGCVNCYAADAAKSPRLQQFPQYQEVKEWNGKTTFVESQLLKPLSWKSPRKVFVCSMSDLFHENTPDEWIDRIFAVMALCPQHIFQVLTKRPERMLEYRKSNITKAAQAIDISPKVKQENPWSFANIWCGVTVENQKAANERIPLLQQTPAAIRFLSCEPLLEDVKLDLTGIDWVIVGGESGTGSRPCHLDWIRSVVHQCKAAGVPVFVKQLGACAINRKPYISEVADTYYQLKLKSRKGGEIEEWPEDLRIREFPKT